MKVQMQLRMATQIMLVLAKYQCHNDGRSACSTGIVIDTHLTEASCHSSVAVQCLGSNPTTESYNGHRRVGQLQPNVVVARKHCCCERHC